MNLVFGEAGLYCYIVLAILASNIAVLKGTQFDFFPEPIALGTVFFSSIFLATDILSELYGYKSSQKAVFLGFSALLIWLVFTYFVIGYAPLTQEQAVNTPFFLESHIHITAIFSVIPLFFISSIIAFLISQSCDIGLFLMLKKLTAGRFLWLRNNVSTLISALIDSAVFSILAFIVFASEPLPFRTVLLSYVFGTYIVRVAIALLDTPFIYIAKAFHRRPLNKKNTEQTFAPGPYDIPNQDTRT